ncbi:MAG: hypothetical protein IIC83_00870 [Chloroflexi bacterium]|nr:hypothetical protein [Chloroflexota bacterium]
MAVGPKVRGLHPTIELLPTLGESGKARRGGVGLYEITTQAMASVS